MPDETAAAPESAGAASPPPKTSAYQVVQQPVQIDGKGKFYLKGQKLFLTSEQATALGKDQVVPLVPPAQKKPDAPAIAAPTSPALTPPKVTPAAKQEASK